MMQLVYSLRSVVPYSALGDNEVMTFVKDKGIVFIFLKNKLLVVSFKYELRSESLMVDKNSSYDLIIQEPTKSQGRTHQKAVIAILIQICIFTFLFFHDNTDTKSHQQTCIICSQFYNNLYLIGIQDLQLEYYSEKSTCFEVS